MANEVLFEWELYFHDESKITIVADREVWDRSVGGKANTDRVTFTVSSSAVSTNFGLTAEEAGDLSRVLAAAVKALA